uniref:Uncharacterized protein n=1 Tax=Zea mays TaxID=4577 RepID=B6TP87_MAIZE|nr:hypothetical protein [Zea mays]
MVVVRSSPGSFGPELRGGALCLRGCAAATPLCGCAACYAALRLRARAVAGAHTATFNSTVLQLRHMQGDRPTASGRAPAHGGGVHHRQGPHPCVRMLWRGGYGS